METELKGAKVRSLETGAPGTIEHVSASKVEIAWDDGTALLPEYVVYSRDDDRLFGEMEVFLINRGWVPLGDILASDTLRDQKTAIEMEPGSWGEARADHNPFQHERDLGPGPRGKQRSSQQRHDCEREGAYVQLCRDRRTGRVKRVRVDKDWKRRYNRDWDQFQKRRKHRNPDRGA